MALPLPRVVPDTGPGGGLVTAMGGINALHDAMIKKKMNEIKSQYLPGTLQAEAASKLAYANLMGPQFLAKLLQNPGALANMGDSRAREALNRSVSAGMGVANNNSLNNIPQHTGIGQPSTNNFGHKVKNFFGKLLGFDEQQEQQQNNPFSQNNYQRPSQNQQDYELPTNGLNQNPSINSRPEPRPANAVSQEGQQCYDKNGNPIYTETESEEDRNKHPSEPMGMELTAGIKPKTYAQNTGEYLGTVKQLEKEGEYRAAAKKQIGESLLGLSHSGAVLDRLTGVIKNPVFSNMRNKIPGFQNKQLDYLKVMGTPEEKELIGDFLSTGESFIASTVQGFSGKPLVREFDLAQRQKITPHDTIESATGKLHSARALHDIAEKKNQIVSELLDKGYNEAEAVKKANKMVDVTAIEKATNKLLQRKITITNDKTGKSKEVTIEEARKLGVPNV